MNGEAGAGIMLVVLTALGATLGWFAGAQLDARLIGGLVGGVAGAAAGFAAVYRLYVAPAIQRSKTTDYTHISPLTDEDDDDDDWHK